MGADGAGQSDLLFVCSLDPGRAQAAIRSGLIQGAWRDPWAEGVAGLVFRDRFVAWRLHGSPEDRVLPRTALVGRVEAHPRGARIRGRYRAPAPDTALVLPLVMFSALALSVFGLAGVAGVLVVTIGWGIPARLIAARFLARDAPALERWLQARLDPDVGAAGDGGPPGARLRRSST